MSKEDRVSLLSVRQLACGVGRLQWALMEEGRVLIRISDEGREKPKRPLRPVMIINEATNQPIDNYADALDPSVESDGTSAVYVTMGFGAILFKSHTEGEAGGNTASEPTFGAE